MRRWPGWRGGCRRRALLRSCGSFQFQRVRSGPCWPVRAAARQSRAGPSSGSLGMAGPSPVPLPVIRGPKPLPQDPQFEGERVPQVPTPASPHGEEPPCAHNTCPGKGGRVPVHATWLWPSCREIWDMFWLLEDGSSLTPGTWTTEELGGDGSCRHMLAGRNHTPDPTPGMGHWMQPRCPCRRV